MRAFATLLDRLSFTASRNAKLVLVRDYLKAAPDPERGWALACLTGELTFRRGQAGDDQEGGGGAGGPDPVPLVLRLRRRSGGDGGAGLARQARRQPRAGAERGGGRAARRPPFLHPEADRGVAGCAGRRRPLGAAQAAHRRIAGRPLRPPRQAGGGGYGGELWAGREPSPTSRRSGTRWSRPTPNSSNGWRVAVRAPTPTRRAASAR